MTTAVFGEKGGYTESEAMPVTLPENTLNTVFFTALMTIVNIILLNLLIAIMATSYTRVQEYSHLGKDSFIFVSHKFCVWLITHSSLQRRCMSGPQLSWKWSSRFCLS